jgi:hypothetical protein
VRPIEQPCKKRSELLSADCLLAILGAEEDRIAVKESQHSIDVTPTQPSNQETERILDDLIRRARSHTGIFASHRGDGFPRRHRCNVTIATATTEKGRQPLNQPWP